MIKIIVDSTCDLPEEYINKYDIRVLPLRVYLSDHEYLDKVTIQVDQVYDEMRKGVVPETSQPRPMDMIRLFREYCEKGISFIYLAFSSKLSGTYQSAASIVGELREEYPETEMEVVDSKGGSTATGLIALQAARMADAGKGFSIILRQINEMIEHVEHIFTITDLTWLIKGGRIGKGAGLVGNLLDIKPILDVENGLMEVIQKVRGKRKALNTVADIIAERIKDFPEQIIGISHADDMDTALQLYELIKQRVGEGKVIINKIGSVLGSHLGIGGVGAFFFNKRPEIYIE